MQSLTGTSILRAIAVAGLLWMVLPSPSMAAEQGASAPADSEADVEDHRIEGFQRHRLFYSNLLVIRYNALGLQNLFDLGYRYQLYNDDRPLFKDSYLGVSFKPLVTPAYAQIGAALKAQPLAVLAFEARFSYMQYYSSFDLVQSFASASADYSDSTIEDGGGQDLNYAGSGFQMNLITTLQGKVGPVIVRNTLQAAYHDMNLQNKSNNLDGSKPKLQPGTRVWYDQYFDIMAPKQGWLINYDLDVFYQPNEQWLLGMRYTLTKAFYDNDNFLPGEKTDDPNGPTHKIGPACAYIFYDDPGASFNKPTILVLVNWWLDHRWRTGEDVSQALPYIVLGFAFSGDLL